MPISVIVKTFDKAFIVDRMSGKHDPHKLASSSALKAGDVCESLKNVLLKWVMKVD